MKRKLLFLAFVLSTVVGWSQTVTLKFKNGTTQQYNLSELESIDFKDGNDNQNNGNDNQNKTFYDVLQINGVSYACFGYRSIFVYRSSWDLSKHSGQIVLPCGSLSLAQNGEFHYDYMYLLNLKGSQELEIGSKLENFSPTFKRLGKEELSYVSGSATVIDKLYRKYITIRFDSFTFGYGSNSYSLDGTVQLSFHED